MKFLLYQLIAVLACLILFPAMVVKYASDKIISIEDVSETNVAIVFGAGIRSNDTPSDMLSDRLNVAAKLYESGSVKRILVSGDNSVEGYSEPDVMKDTLMDEYGIPEEVIFADYAGRRTYDTCARAHDLWGVDNAVLVTQGYHLPRAVFTCENLGVESIGVSASLRPYVFESKYKAREFLAIDKAALDIFILHPKYIGGKFLEDIDY